MKCSGAQPLDYELVQDESEKRWEVWTPNLAVGACIGGGRTPVEALTDAHESMTLTIKKIKTQISLGRY